MEGTAGIVLVGGRSSRMGAPKAALEWHGSTLLRRVAGLVGRAAGPVVVVRAPGQALPALPPGARVVEDGRPGRGPLQGLLAGLEALDGEAEAAYASAVDAPLLHPALVARVLGGLAGGAEAAVPRAGGRRHPLAAAYRVALASRVRALLAEDRLAMSALLDAVRAAWLDEDDLLADPVLARADPRLDSLRNLNGPADHAAAAALPPPAVRVRDPGGREAAVRAATLGAALARAGSRAHPDECLVAGPWGDGVGEGPDTPLAAGDLVLVRAPAAGSAPAA